MSLFVAFVTFFIYCLNATAFSFDCLPEFFISSEINRAVRLSSVLSFLDVDCTRSVHGMCLYSSGRVANIFEMIISSIILVLRALSLVAILFNLLTWLLYPWFFHNSNRRMFGEGCIFIAHYPFRK